MNTDSSTLSLKMTGRLAGLFYLLLAIPAPFSMIYVPTKLIVWNDAAATFANFTAHETLFRLSLLGDSLIILLEIVLIVLLYRLFKPVSQTWSMTATLARLGMTIIQGVNVLVHAAVLVLLSKAAYLKVFQPEQIQALMMMLLNAHQYGVYVWEIFFGFHLIVLGALVYKSGYYPKILGVLLALASVGYLMESYTHLLLPEPEVFSTVTSVFLAITTLGEIAFLVWLLIKGAGEPKTKSI